MLLLMVNCLSSNISIIKNKRIFKILINCGNISGWSNTIGSRISTDRRYICSKINKIKRRYRWNRIILLTYISLNSIIISAILFIITATHYTFIHNNQHYSQYYHLYQTIKHLKKLNVVAAIQVVESR